MKKETIQERVLAMYEEGFSPREMYEELDTTISTIYAYHSKFKLTPHKRPIICPHCGKNTNV